MQCEGRVAIVTGAAGKGIGRSIALTLAREGAKVVVNYRESSESARAIVKHIVDEGGKAIAVQADVLTGEGCRTLVAAAVQEFGQVDICVVNPGGGFHMEPPEKLDAAAAVEDAKAELAPLYHLMPLVLPGMYERGWGRLVGVSLREPGSPSYAYDAAKAARTGAMLMLRDQAWEHGVAVNVIGPGPVAALGALDEAIEHCRHGKKWIERGAASPQDIAEAVAFLCSEAGRFVSGCHVPFMGG